MLLVSCARINILIKNIDNKEINGINFKLNKLDGLMAYINHDSDDETAKKTLKEKAKGIPELKNMFLNIRTIDDSGNIK